MGIWARIKALSSRPWTQASMRMLPGVGNGASYRPYNYDEAVKQFQGWVYAAAMMNAQGVASTPLRLYRRRSKAGMRSAVATRAVSRKTLARFAGDGRGGAGGAGVSHYVLRKAAEWGNQYEEVVDQTPVLDVLHKVNPYLNGYQLSLLRVIWQELTGNAYLHPVIDPQTGVPGELWPMPPQWITVLSDETRLVAGYRYGRVSAPQGEANFRPEEVIHFKYPNPKNLIYGLGKVEAAWGAVTVSASKRNMDVALFDNMARPDYLMVVKSGATNEALDRFEASVNEKLRGVHQSGKFMAITGDIELQPLNFAPKELGNPEAVVEEIAAVFGVPVSKLKTNDPNRSNADSGNNAWLRDTIHPLCVQDEEKLNESYLPLFGLQDDAFLAYDNPVPGDEKAEMLRYIACVQNAIMTPNEVRAEMGMAPMTPQQMAEMQPAIAPGSKPTTPEAPDRDPGGDSDTED